MKKIIALVLTLVMALSLVACGGNKAEEKPAEKPADTKTEAPADTKTEAPAEAEKKDIGNYPEKAISAISVYAAGGGSDTSFRSVLKHWEKTLGASFVVSNVAGGSGTVGATYIAEQPNDGYLVGNLTMGTQVMSPFELDVTYEIDDFDYIGGFGMYSYGWVVHPDGWDTVEEMIAASKEKPIKVVTTSTIHNIAIQKAAEATGANFDIVYYTATSDAATDLMAGRIDVLVSDNASFSKFIASGQLKLLVVSSGARWDVAPDVKTFTELGYKDCEVNSYTGVGAPKGVDPAILEHLRETFYEAVSSEEFKKELAETVFLTPNPLTGEEYRQLLIENRDNNADYVEKILASKG